VHAAKTVDVGAGGYEVWKPKELPPGAGIRILMRVKGFKVRGARHAWMDACVSSAPCSFLLMATRPLTPSTQSALEMKLMLTPRELIFICRQIASALDYVHSMVRKKMMAAVFVASHECSMCK
jgi:hypothetical protein